MACAVGRAAVRRTPKLGDRDGLPLCAALRDESADVVAEVRGRRLRPLALKIAPLRRLALTNSPPVAPAGPPAAPRR